MSRTPKYSWAEGSNEIRKILIGIISFVEKQHKKEIKKQLQLEKQKKQNLRESRIKLKEENKQKKLNEQISKSDFEITSKTKQYNTKIIKVENKKITIEFWITTQYDNSFNVNAHAHLKFKNGKGYYKTFNNSEHFTCPNYYYENDEYLKLVSKKIFLLATKSYEYATQKKYKYTDPNPFSQ